jgi:hypothetical protein
VQQQVEQQEQQEQQQQQVEQQELLLNQAGVQWEKYFFQEVCHKTEDKVQQQG